MKLMRERVGVCLVVASELAAKINWKPGYADFTLVVGFVLGLIVGSGMEALVRLAQDKNGRYYDADRFGDDYNWWTARPGESYVWLCILGDRAIPEESEEEVIARTRREARLIMRAAIERDFDEGTLITKVELA